MKDNEKGFYLVIMPIILVVLLFVVGFAIDIGKLQLDKIKLQSSADAATIVAGSRIGLLTNPQLEQLAFAVAEDNQNSSNLNFDSNTTTATMVTDNEIEVNTSINSETFIIGKVVDGQKDHILDVSSASHRRPVALTIVADVSGSMLCPSNSPCEPYNQFQWVWRSDGASCDPNFYVADRNGVEDDICEPILPQGQESRIESLKRAAKEFIGSFDPNRDVVSVVKYAKPSSDISSSVFDLATNYNLSAVNNSIDDLNAGGGTPMHSGIVKGVEQINTLGALTDLDGNVLNPDAYLKVVVFITDGVPNHNAPVDSNGNELNQPSIDCQGALSVGYTHSFDHMEPYVRTMDAADIARSNDVLFYGIGIGAADTSNMNDVFQSINSQSLKSIFMRRIVNDNRLANGYTDPVTGQYTQPDPQLPFQCANTYGNVVGGVGEYLEAPNGSGISDMLSRVRLSIQMKLTK